MRRILATNICATFQQARALKEEHPEQYFRPLLWAIIHSPRSILKLIRWCSIRRVLWWPELPSSANSFRLTHLMWLWYKRVTYSCSGAQGGSGSVESSKKNTQSTRLGKLHIWGTPPLTRSFIMAKNRQGAWTGGLPPERGSGFSPVCLRPLY